jgi:hypothetical protein
VRHNDRASAKGSTEDELELDDDELEELELEEDELELDELDDELLLLELDEGEDSDDELLDEELELELLEDDDELEDEELELDDDGELELDDELELEEEELELDDKLLDDDDELLDNDELELELDGEDPELDDELLLPLEPDKLELSEAELPEEARDGEGLGLSDGDELEGLESTPPGTVKAPTERCPAPQSNQHVTVTVSPGLRSARCNSIPVLFRAGSATVECSRLQLVSTQVSIAFRSVLLM